LHAEGLAYFYGGTCVFLQQALTNPSPDAGEGRIFAKLYCLYGALVLQLPEEYHPGGQWCRELPTEQLATGVYLCVVSVERRQYRQRVLVIR
jgi:hypothetical protein